ncbi:MAG: RtcB family protein [Spirochaetes bacterium]|nr:RtcB family protein [Spirochaetota bacterium]
MKWIYDKKVKLPIKSWCENVEDGALQQAINLANHPVLYQHVALMPDCHIGYGMPIGGVIATEQAVIPNAVGVDIGCGMGAIETNLKQENLKDKELIRKIINALKSRIPVGEGHAHQHEQHWTGFEQYLDSVQRKPAGWWNQKSWELDSRNLGTLGGGNHFIELQVADSGKIWLMLHSGSRNLGHRIASYYHQKAVELTTKQHIALPDKNLAFLHMEGQGQKYIHDMNFALSYAMENRRKMMEIFKEIMTDFFKNIEFTQEINIHHNYAALESHFGKKVWVHRKGATAASKDLKGIIPGSMGTASYIVQGLGNPQSFMSCSHGAGRVLGRKEACRRLTVEECNKAMAGVVFDRWSKYRGWGKKKNNLYDLSEAPLAYKNIDTVIEAQDDLVIPLVKLKPLGVVKG